eukprot:TRINITY_DN13643_c0_g1_i1.p1 TRINITY_DN13643_c0_g1~~TRINITY_DN13643_c0_g1_i1.p1  ORF type:complete len:256 (+),score=75.59 TRINITY_DN13643_c0_g1_i1:99-866(+)
MEKRSASAGMRMPGCSLLPCLALWLSLARCLAAATSQAQPPPPPRALALVASSAGDGQRLLRLRGGSRSGASATNVSERLMIEAIVASQDEVLDRLDATKQEIEEASRQLRSDLAMGNATADDMNNLSGRVLVLDTLTKENNMTLINLNASKFAAIAEEEKTIKALDPLNVTAAKIEANLKLIRGIRSAEKRVADDQRSLNMLEPRLQKLSAHVDRIDETLGFGDLSHFFSQEVDDQIREVSKDTGRIMARDLEQ